ncbi:hypothetical protein CDD83_3357 [Cordyceps sp. RAO-2017]|nr:hypothetical protein CDD83_3357 [Cordyceps sp. RAO-2017]
MCGQAPPGFVRLDMAVDIEDLDSSPECDDETFKSAGCTAEMEKGAKCAGQQTEGAQRCCAGKVQVRNLEGDCVEAGNPWTKVGPLQIFLRKRQCDGCEVAGPYGPCCQDSDEWRNPDDGKCSKGKQGVPSEADLRMKRMIDGCEGLNAMASAMVHENITENTRIFAS